VDSRIDGLRIVCAEDITLGTGGTACLSLNGDTTLTGGPLTAESSSVLGRGISLGLGAGLTVQDMTLTAGGSRRGITGDGTGESLLVRASDVTATGSNAAVWNLDGGVILDGCELLEPIGGSFSGGQYLEADGAAAAKTVKIVSEHVIEGSLSVSGGTMTYTLTLPDDGSEITLIAAWYDGAGQMLGCAEKAVTCAGVALGETLPVEPGADTYKLFILDENDMPLAPALVQ